MAMASILRVMVSMFYVVMKPKELTSLVLEKKYTKNTSLGLGVHYMGGKCTISEGWGLYRK